MLGAVTALSSEVVLSGHTASQLDPGLKGQVLLEEMNCAACHPGDGSLAAGSKKSPRLADVGSRVRPEYLQEFIADPLRTKPGTTMPDVLAGRGEEERREIALSITHFLLSRKPNDFSPEPPDPVAAGLGRRLFQARGCAACHSPRDEQGLEVATEGSTPLGPLDKKYSFRSLVQFLSRPHAVRPSGRMPDLQMPGKEVESVAHFLLQRTRVPGALAYTLYRGQVWEGLDSDEVKAERGGQVKDFALGSLGEIHHHTAITYDGWINLPKAGRYQFFLEMNGGSLVVDGSEVVRQAPSDRRGVMRLEGGMVLAAGWRRLQVTYFHTGREPQFSFDFEGPGLERGPVSSAQLSVSNEPVPAFAPLEVDAGLAARGRELFASFGCANCHDDLEVRSAAGPAWAGLDAGRGCLSEAAGAWPRFGLNAEQRRLMAGALPHAESLKLSDAQRVDKTLVTFNCLACHERTGLGGPAPERAALFSGTQPALGDQGRLPPPLSHVGAKLTPEWLREVMLKGKRQREYVDAAMPQFGEANIGHLVELFGKVDTLEEAVLPRVSNLRESKDAGYEMVGATGLGCIACHEFNGQKAGEMSALDIAHVTERLQKNWFALYMRQPSRFHPTVIMPSYWPDGQSIRPAILGGDTAQQIEALWVYLQDGERAKKPLGLSRQSNEVRVGDVAEICRGQSPIGYRGIGVGYPERLNLVFDSGEMALRQLWKGEFASVDAGSFHPRGTDQISFPPGVPFHRLNSMDDDWPYKGKTNHTFPQDQGYQFLGYRLDPARRPTFRYRYGELMVEDFFEDVRGADGAAWFKRTLTLEAGAAPTPFHFRAAAGEKITAETDQLFKIGGLELRLLSDHHGIVRQGSRGEVLVLLAPAAGRTTLTLEYRW
jgi:cytochrome c553